MKMHWYGNHMYFGGWWLMMLVFMIFWALVIGAALLYWRPKRPDEQTSHRAVRKDPFAILDERFARGEIEETEYFSRIEALHNSQR